jgi:hypothetical protein
MSQGCQMVYFRTKKTNLGIFILDGLEMANVGIFYIRPFVIFDGHFVHICYSHFVILVYFPLFWYTYILF